jgi:hypothetical protein
VHHPIHLVDQLTEIHLGDDDGFHLSGQLLELQIGERPQGYRPEQADPDAFFPRRPDGGPGGARRHAVRKDGDLRIVEEIGFIGHDLFPTLLNLPMEPPLLRLDDSRILCGEPSFVMSQSRNVMSIPLPEAGKRRDVVLVALVRQIRVR